MIRVFFQVVVFRPADAKERWPGLVLHLAGLQMPKVIIFACSRMDTLAHVPCCAMNCSHVALQLSGGAESAAAVLALCGAIGLITRLPTERRRVAESMQARVSRDLDVVGVQREVLVPMHCR